MSRFLLLFPWFERLEYAAATVVQAAVEAATVVEAVVEAAAVAVVATAAELSTRQTKGISSSLIALSNDSKAANLSGGEERL
jgi:hypothetical protein